MKPCVQEEKGMARIKLTITESRCRDGFCKAGEEFIVEGVCPPICHELWHAIYPQVFALINGADLDYGSKKDICFAGQCPDGGRVKVHGERIE